VAIGENGSEKFDVIVLIKNIISWICGTASVFHWRDEFLFFALRIIFCSASRQHQIFQRIF
jgi:hypothetical protein